MSRAGAVRGATDGRAGDPVPLAVSARGVRKSYGARGVLAGLDLDIADGEIVAMLGRSGCGKSTLLRVIAGLEQHDGAERLEAPDAVGIGFQEPRLLPWKRVHDNVVLGMRGARRTETRAFAERALEAVGLAGRGGSWPLQLSGGEAQRVSLARAVVREPWLLLLDEPFSALDALTRRTMHELLRELHDRLGPAVLFVTHDVDEALALADRVLVLEGGAVAFDVPVARTGREELLARLGA